MSHTLKFIVYDADTKTETSKFYLISDIEMVNGGGPKATWQDVIEQKGKKLVADVAEELRLSNGHK